MAIEKPEQRREASGHIMEAFHHIRVAMDTHTHSWSFGFAEQTRRNRALEAAENEIKEARRALHP